MSEDNYARKAAAAVGLGPTTSGGAYANMASGAKNEPGGQVAPMGKWLPIASAPLNTDVLLFDNCEICVGRSYTHPGGTSWSPVPSSWESDSVYPTHWMHLPEPPQ